MSKSRARFKLSKIQKRDQMFKENHRLQFKTPSTIPRAKKHCLVDGEHITNPVDIANHFRSLYDALASSNTTSPNVLPVASGIEQLEDIALGCDDQVIDTEFCIEEIEGALKSLKPNRSGGPDGLKAEHFKYGDEHLKLWLKRVFKRLIIWNVYPNV